MHIHSNYSFYNLFMWMYIFSSLWKCYPHVHQRTGHHALIDTDDKNTRIFKANMLTTLLEVVQDRIWIRIPILNVFQEAGLCIMEMMNLFVVESFES